MNRFFCKATLIESLFFGTAFWNFPYSSSLIFLPVIFVSCLKNYRKNTPSKLNITQMKATFYNFGPGFIIKEVNLPKYSNDELLIEVKAAAINPFDYKYITPTMPFYRWMVPHTVGNDFSGIVIEKGSNVKDFQVGDEVCGNAFGGCLQQYTIAKKDQITLKPKNFSFQEAASYGKASQTAYLALTYWGDLKGKKLLVIGASGGTGSFGLQIAKYLGADVTAVNSTRNNDFVKSLGPDRIFNYNEEGFLDKMKDERYDLVLDTVSSAEQENQEKYYKCFLKPDGKWLALSGSKDDYLRAILSKIFLINVERKNYHLTFVRWSSKDLDLFRRMAEEGKLKTKIKVFNLEKKDIKTAFEELQSRKTVGKIVFDI